MNTTKNIATSIATIQNEFATILTAQNTAAILPFLKKLSPADKKALLPFLRKQMKHYNEVIEIKKNTHGVRKTEEEAYILNRAAMACFDLKTIKRSFWRFDEELIDEITSFFQPKWLDQYINDFVREEFIPMNLNYHWLLRKQQAGLIQPSEELLARTLCNVILTNTLGWKHRFTPEKIEAYPITLQKHFWYFFQYETTIYSTTRWTDFKGATNRETANWLAVIQDLVKAGKLPRKRLLKESLIATNRNFNRNLITWYINIFSALSPSLNELLELQPQLFQVFNAAQSKPINVVLKCCKQLVKSPEFDGTAFLENVPILLASETKSIVQSTLIILDTLAKKQARLVDQICTAVCDTFMHQNATLQTRAAKIIVKYGKIEQEALKVAILPFQSNLLAKTRKLLVDFVEINPADSNAGNDVNYPVAAIPILEENKAIQISQNFNDLVFLANQALVGNNAWDIELLLAALLKLNGQLTSENCEKLAPALQRAYQYIFKGISNARVGNFELMTAHFLAEYTQILLKRFPAFDKLEVALKNYLKKEATYQLNWKNYVPKSISLLSWTTFGESKIYKPFQFVLLHTLDLLKQNSSLPLLSTPTHQPYWIDPVVFINRLAIYQTKKVTPNPADLQIAIARIAFENKKAAIELAKSILTGEYLALVLFLLANQPPPSDNLQYLQVWQIAALTKSQIATKDLDFFFPKEIQSTYLGEFQYAFSNEMRTYKQYNPTTKKYEKETHQHKQLTVRTDKGILPKIWDGIKNLFKSTILRENFFLRSYLQVDNVWDTNQNDLIRFISLSPNNPTPVAAYIIKNCLKYPEFWEETSKKTVRSFIQILLENWRGGGEMMHLFVATALTCSDKTARLIAAELWIKGISENSMNSQLIGKILGKMEQVDFFPLKRLLDSLQEVLFNISPYHNQALIIMLNELIVLMPTKPIRNTKRLLEIYLELVGLTEQKMDNPALRAKLNAWSEIKSLNKIGATILQVLPAA